MSEYYDNLGLKLRRVDLLVKLIDVARGGPGCLGPKGSGKNCTTVLAVQKGQIYT